MHYESTYKLDDTPDDRVKYGCCGDWAERHNDGNFCMDGLCYPHRTPHTVLLELKQVYRSVRVYRNGGEFVIKSLLLFADAGEMLDGHYKVTYDGGKSDTGSFNFSVSPMGETALSLRLKKTLLWYLRNHRRDLLCQESTPR